jgi:hypothetical protein
MKELRVQRICRFSWYLTCCRYSWAYRSLACTCLRWEKQFCEGRQTEPGDRSEADDSLEPLVKDRSEADDSLDSLQPLVEEPLIEEPPSKGYCFLCWCALKSS